MLGFFALLASLWTAPPCETGFCSCVGPRDVPTALESADAVFAGKVVAVRDSMDTSDGSYGGWGMRVVTLRVDRAWKGTVSERVVVTTGMGSGDCGFSFQRGKSYLVYAHTSPRAAGLNTSICGRTALLRRARADVRELGTPVWRRPR